MSPAPYTVTKPRRLHSEPWSTRTAFLLACEASVDLPHTQKKRREKNKGRERGEEDRKSFPVRPRSSNNLCIALSDHPPVYVPHVGPQSSLPSSEFCFLKPSVTSDCPKFKSRLLHMGDIVLHDLVLAFPFYFVYQPFP